MKNTQEQDRPVLKDFGLYAAKTGGNGNCLFNALSDQLNGHEGMHREYRKTAVDYMLTHSDEFKPFVVVSGMSPRRNPKRKTAGSLQNRMDIEPAPTQEQIDKAFQQACENMAKGGTFADNAEIVAFAKAFQIIVRIWSEEHHFFYNIGPGGDAAVNLPKLWIVHHTWEHFSSIRNIAGPHTGRPDVQAEDDIIATDESSNTNVEKWMIEAVARSLPWPLNQLPDNRINIEKALLQHGLDINLTVSTLLPESSPESSRSSSIERDPDSDDERVQGPKKRRDRRAGRPHPLRNDLANQASEKALDSPDPARLVAALQTVNSQDKLYDPDETEEDRDQDESQSKYSESSATSSVSEYSSSDQPKEGGVRLTLKAPKKPAAQTVNFPTNSPSKLKIRNTSETPSEADQKSPQGRVKAKPKRRLINGNQRNKEMAEQAARNSANQKLDILKIHAISI